MNLTSSNPALMPGFRTDPIWWDAAPPTATAPRPLPADADVAILGAGCTGLSAALTLARAGRSVVVCEAGRLGEGATSRSTGVLGRTLKHGFSAILDQHGAERARRVYGEARLAFDFILGLIEREAIECSLVRAGRYMAANSPRHYETMARDLELMRQHLGDEFAMVPRERQHEELGSDLYAGGAVVPDHRLLHPGMLLHGLIKCVGGSGAQIHPATRVTGIRREARGFALETSAGRFRAGNVLVATNGYTGAATPWLRRRAIRLDAYMVATEPLPPETMRRILPNGRCFHDYTINADYGRPSHDGRRLLFGGLTGTACRDIAGHAARLHARLVRILPDLAQTRFSHVWTGSCAATFDLYPHIGEHDGVHFALGYCFGSGLPLGTWLGHLAARRILGQIGAQTAFDDLPLTSQPFYWGRPWFVPLAVRYYHWVDRRGF